MAKTKAQLIEESGKLFDENALLRGRLDRLEQQAERISVLVCTTGVVVRERASYHRGKADAFDEVALECERIWKGEKSNDTDQALHNP